jgi:hypothetical protein
MRAGERGLTPWRGRERPAFRLGVGVPARPRGAPTSPLAGGSTLPKLEAVFRFMKLSALASFISRAATVNADATGPEPIYQGRGSPSAEQLENWSSLE